MALPKPLHSHGTGMPQRRRKSAIRTANADMQQDFLERVRAVAEDPTLVLPECVGDEPGALRALRTRLERAKDGRLPFTARFDKGLLGALHAARKVATLDAAPRLLDARIDGQRRFYLQRGQAKRLVNLGVQNWDDPLALMLAYGRLAPRQGLFLFAGSRLWCTGTAPAPPPQWYLDLGERTGIGLSPDGEGAACPHGDRPRLELRFRSRRGNGPRILVCGPCGARAAGEGIRNLHAHVLNRALGDPPAKPVEPAVRLPGGEALQVSDGLAQAYRLGKANEQDLVDAALKSWHGEARGGAGRFVLGARSFATQDEFLAALELADWERAAVRVLTAGGHVGPEAAASDVLSLHRDRLPEALDALLGPGQGAAFLARHPGSEVRPTLRLAHEEAERRAKVRNLPDLGDLGTLGRWLDRWARDARTLPRAELLQRVRKEAPASPHPAHLQAILCALGLESEGVRHLTHDQKEAGRHWAPLAKRVLEAEGEAYRAAVVDYLRETGAGEGA
jgi:hypothetical protein